MLPGPPTPTLPWHRSDWQTGCYWICRLQTPRLNRFPFSIHRERNKHLRDERDIHFQVSGRCHFPWGVDKDCGPVAARTWAGVSQECPEAWGLGASFCVSKIMAQAFLKIIKNVGWPLGNGINFLWNHTLSSWHSETNKYLGGSHTSWMQKW